MTHLLMLLLLLLLGIHRMMLWSRQRQGQLIGTNSLILARTWLLVLLQLLRLRLNGHRIALLRLLLLFLLLLGHWSG